MAAVQKWLPVLADVATVVVGVIVIGMLGSRYLSPPGEFPTPDTYIGVNLNDALGIDIKQAANTLVVAVQQGCPACDMSMPFYERMTDLDDVRVVVAAPKRDIEIAAYLESYGVEPDDIAILDDDRRVATPTLLIVDLNGLVTHSWIGVLSQDAEAEVLELLTGAAV